MIKTMKNWYGVMSHVLHLDACTKHKQKLLTDLYLYIYTHIVVHVASMHKVIALFPGPRPASVTCSVEKGESLVSFFTQA